MSKQRMDTPKTAMAVMALAAGGAFLAACGLQFRPLDKTAGSDAAAVASQETGVVFRFFDDDFTPGGYQYTYPDASKIHIPEESGHDSEVSLLFELEAGEYSGGSVCLYNLLYDMTPYYDKGALEFWIKGENGGEIAWAALVDDENRDGKKSVVRLPLQNYGGISKEWRKVSIPLHDFGKRGVFWDAKKRIEVPYAFDWNAVAEFRIEIKKAENPSFRVYVDDIFIRSNVFEAKEEAPVDLWEDKQETVSPPPVAAASGDKPKALHDLFVNSFPSGGFTYVYGGRTAAATQPMAGDKDRNVLAAYLDNDDYSGVTLSLGTGKVLDLAELRNAKGALQFWGKGSPGTRQVYIGLLDDESDGNKVQTKITLADFLPIDTTWRLYQIPLKRFPLSGRYWDAKKGGEVAADMNFARFQEFRVSNNKGENRAEPGQPVTFYVADLQVIDHIPGYVDPEVYWANFDSKEPDRLLHDFEGKADATGWSTGHGPKSEVSFRLVSETEPGMGKKSLETTYRLADWCDVLYRYDDAGRPEADRDWTKHFGLKFSLYTEKAYQGVTVQVQDAGNEIFVSNIGASRGWNEILVPFSTFSKFPYYQPPDAQQNGTFDLKGIRVLDFKPSGDGSRGVYRIDNVTLTNLREVKKAPVAEKVAVTVNAEAGKTVTAKIPPGIFGINAALWDGDLLDPKTEKYVKAVNHHVLRYPGGLRADDDHWKEVLDKKDFMVDTDEFLEFCEKTGTTAMITVNFGTGTPQEAADWVHHVNIKKKAGVKLWEVGNELYGDWHANYTTGDDYGKRTAEFIKAMKKVDPTIKVGVVWVLEGEWNKEVFKHTKDLADAVIVHHYPQHSGEENDAALLAAPQSLDHILPSVKEQIEKFGKKGKHYEIWLTEWNSVDFKPGPQTLGMVNALFVADYLGMLARHGIEHADYWDIHNDITEQGGDYGYLSRTGAPDGDNVPRPSYWAFKLASQALRGRLAECATNKPEVTCYLADQPNGKKSMLLVNKFPETAAEIKIQGWAPGSNAKAWRLNKEKAAQAPVEISAGEALKLPAHSITVIQE